jgi:NAD(P)-dependent dehydrogenase (short-subunit alcohol dehydrogenase family)
MEPLDGKVAWIAGAGGGIGRACAVAFARAGARVALTGRRLPPLEETAVLTGAPPGDVVMAPADVSDAGAVAAAHAKIVAALGDPLVLANSAGGNVKQRHWGNLAPASASEVIDLDLTAMFYCTSPPSR